MNKKEILRKVDHTLLKPEATWPEVQNLCDEAMDWNAASVCISPVYVQRAAAYVAGSLPICTVIGFPSGASTREVKVLETQDAVQNGAAELDMVIQLGLVKMARWDAVLEEIRGVRKACPGKVLKVIVEACLLTKEEKLRLCQLVSDSGADYIKTSTGFSTGGASYDDVALFKRALAPHVKIKAAGGVRDWSSAAEFIRLGADRIGSSALIPLARQEGLE